MLHYRALLFRAFFNTPNGPQEFAYIPDDLLDVVRKWETQSARVPEELAAAEFAGPPEPPGRGATPGERRHVLPTTDAILDDVTTLLAAVRAGREPQPADPKLPALLKAAGLLSGEAEAGEVNAGRVKRFLEAPRAEALRMLIDAWQTSDEFNELRLMPGLLFEGEWQNQLLITREFLLDVLHGIPAGAWWNLGSFVNGVKKEYPDFQRPAGDYDSWFIRRESDGTYLRGFAYWDQVDGALVRFFITDVLAWLGIAELARGDEQGPVTAFHLPDVPPTREETGRITVSMSGQIVVQRTAPRAVRYQLARFCEWGEQRADEYRYRLTPQSLTAARKQGLRVDHLLALLVRHTEAGVPPVLTQALKRWETNGTEARAESQVILRVSRPEILEELRRSKAGRFLGEPLGPTSVVIKAGAQGRVMAALAEMGLLAEDNTSQAAPGPPE
jgi:hypothetical protein